MLLYRSCRAIHCVTGFGGLCVPLLWLVFLYWAYKAYQGEIFEIP